MPEIPFETCKFKYSLTLSKVLLEVDAVEVPVTVPPPLAGVVSVAGATEAEGAAEFAIGVVWEEVFGRVESGVWGVLTWAFFSPAAAEACTPIIEAKAIDPRASFEFFRINMQRSPRVR